MSDSPFGSLQRTMAFDSRDWAASRSDAWLWGIVCGWADDSLAELQRRYGWGDADVLRLKHLHAEFERCAAAWRES